MMRLPELPDGYFLLALPMAMVIPIALLAVVVASTVPRDCSESAAPLSDGVTCPAPSLVSVRDSEAGPVVLCLCPNATVGDGVPAEWEGTETP